MRVLDQKGKVGLGFGVDHVEIAQQICDIILFP